MKKRGRPKKKVTLKDITSPLLYSKTGNEKPQIQKTSASSLNDNINTACVYTVGADNICAHSVNTVQRKAFLKELVISTNPSGLNNFKFFINPLCVDYVIEGSVVCVIALNGREFYYRGAINELLSILENN